jgi:hypothetical protein
MKKSSFILLLVFTSFFVNGQSSLAGAHASWIGKEIVRADEDLFFKGYKFSTSTILQTDEEIEYHLVSYRKGSTEIFLLITQVPDALSYFIRDVLEIKNMGKNDHVQTGSCKLNDDYNAKILMLEKNIKGKIVKSKAWYTDTDKLKFKSISTKGIDCLVDGI